MPYLCLNQCDITYIEKETYLSFIINNISKHGDDDMFVQTKFIHGTINMHISNFECCEEGFLNFLTLSAQVFIVAQFHYHNIIISSGGIQTNIYRKSLYLSR